MIKYIIFDFDDTLSDFQQTKEDAKVAITPYIREKGIDVAAYWEHYEAIFEPLFAQYVNHELTVEEYRLMRFEHSGVSHEEASRFNEIYLRCVNTAILFDDVMPVLTKLKESGYRLLVLTNGPAIQRRKIEACAAGKLFEQLFISSELGVGKPDIAVYERVIASLQADKDSVLMVGDAYENDCVAAERAGIRAVQVNRRNKPIINYHNQIDSLYDIFKYLS